MLSGQALQAQKIVKPVPLYVDKGSLHYTPDSLGNRIPDFSYCGYKASEQSIPNVTVEIVVPVSKGDATLRIQSALDYVASLPVDANGFRGKVLLNKGTYEIYGKLEMNVSGVVLRGSGMNENGTVLIGAGKNRQTLINIAGVKDWYADTATFAIADSYVPVNAMKFTVDPLALNRNFGNRIGILRPSTKAWIAAIGTEIFGGGISALGWKPGDHDLIFDRTITKIEGNSITIDAPLTTALDSGYGGGTILFL